MLNEQEREMVLSFDGKLKDIPSHLKSKLINSIRDGNSPFPISDDDICCDWGIDPPNRYSKTSEQNCTQLGGTVVDNSNCS